MKLLELLPSRFDGEFVDLKQMERDSIKHATRDALQSVRIKHESNL
jgi:hypothetical protein